jgi:hypothetical protein
MIDRPARNQMAGAIRLYLDGKITAFQFDEAIDNAARKSKDDTAWELRKALWYFYDDCIDHKIRATKAQWDYFHRILLFLESEEELKIEKKQKRSTWQLIAAITLAVFLIIVFHEYLSFVFALFIIFLILYIVTHPVYEFDPDQSKLITLSPFSSFRHILKARRQVAIFRKRPYPVGVTKRRIKGK